MLFFLLCCAQAVGLRITDANRLSRLIHKDGDVVGVRLDSLTVVSDMRMLSKLQVVLDSVDHPLDDILVRRRSKLRKSLLPVVIKLYNSSI